MWSLDFSFVSDRMLNFVSRGHQRNIARERTVVAISVYFNRQATQNPALPAPASEAWALLHHQCYAPWAASPVFSPWHTRSLQQLLQPFCNGMPLVRYSLKNGFSARSLTSPPSRTGSRRGLNSSLVALFKLLLISFIPIFFSSLYFLLVNPSLIQCPIIVSNSLYYTFPN